MHTFSLFCYKVLWVHRIIWDSFTTLKKSFVLHVFNSFPFSHRTLNNHWFAYHLNSFAFSRWSCKWKHTCSFFRLASFTEHLRYVHGFSELGSSFFLCCRMVSVVWMHYDFLSSHLWRTSCLLPVCNDYEYSHYNHYTQVFKFPNQLSVYLEEWLLSHMVSQCLAL